MADDPDREHLVTESLRLCVAAALYVKGPRELGVVHLTNEEQTLFAKKCAYAADVLLFALRETKR